MRIQAGPTTDSPHRDLQHGSLPPLNMVSGLMMWKHNPPANTVAQHAMQAAAILNGSWPMEKFSGLTFSHEASDKSCGKCVSHGCRSRCLGLVCVAKLLERAAAFAYDTLPSG